MADIDLKSENLQKLIDRELEVFQLKCEGYTGKRISERLFIGEQSVKNFLGKSYVKLQIDKLSPAERAQILPQFQPYIAKVIDARKPKKEVENVSSPDTEQHAIVAIDEIDPDTGYDGSIPQTAIIAVLEDELYLVQQLLNAIERVEPPIIEIPLYAQNTPYWNSRRTRIIAIFAGVILFFGVLVGSSVTVFLQREQRQNEDRTAVPTIALVTEIVPTPGSTSVLTVTNIVTSSVTSYCGETKLKEYTIVDNFVQYQGVSLFRPDNTQGIVLNTKVRSLEIDKNGLWIGYAPNDANHSSGVTLYHKPQWIDCTFMPGLMDQTINDIKTDPQGRIWIATEKAGISMYNGTQWKTYTTDDGLPSNEIFGLTIDREGVPFAATWEGVAMFTGTRWDEAYTVVKGTLKDNHIHAVAFDSMSNIWIGHIKNGVTRQDGSSGEWIQYTPLSNTISGVEVRDILVRPSQSTEKESVWIATADGGITKYEAGEWTIYTTKNGLLSDSVIGLTLDSYNRVWAATSGGVMYFDTKWNTYHTLPALNVAVGCKECLIDDDNVWTATADHGLTHSRIPLPVPAIDILEVKYPKIVAPGETFRAEITVSPRSPYKLEAARGDMLANIDANEVNRFGAFVHMTIKEGVIVAPGESYTFTDYENVFVAPQLAPNETEKTFVSTWRIWMHTRYVGDPIRIEFTVKRK